MDSISIRLRSKAETCYLRLSFLDLLYTKIRKRFAKNNAFCGHYYNKEDVPQFTLYYKGKPLPDRPIHFKFLNIHEYDYIDLEYIGLRGGVNHPERDVAIYFYHNNFILPNITVDFSKTLMAIVRNFKSWLFEHNISSSWFRIILHSNVSVSVTPEIWNYTYVSNFKHCEIYFRAHDFDTNPRSSFYISDRMLLEHRIDEYDSDSSVDSAVFREQSGLYSDFNNQTSIVVKTSTNFRKLFQYFMGRHNFDKDYVLKLSEDLILLVDGLYDCYNSGFNTKKIVRTIIIFLKLRSNTSILKIFDDSKISDYISYLVNQPSEESGVLKFLDDADNLVSTLKSGKRLKVCKTLYRLGMFAMSLSLFDSVGLNLDLLGYSAFDKELLKRKNQLTGDTLLDLADGVIFLLKKGYQIILTGRVDCIYHTDDEYSALYDDISDLKLKKIALGNPEALGFNEYWYGDKLDKTMDKLRNVIKYAATLDKNEIRYWRSQLCELELIKNNILIAKNCSESRECPFSLLFFASPGVGKSTLTKMTFQHLAKTHDLPTEDKFMYIRNPMAKYADGFKSEMHTYLLDDISFKHPAANPTGDVSLDEVYMLHGTFQYVPDQAALEDKGRIPVRIKFLLGTTNVKDLNAYHYFSVPSAMQRRFPYIVEVQVKKKYQKDDGSGMLDANKADCSEDEYPNYWNLKVSKILVPKNMGELAKMQNVATFTDINDFTAWLSLTSIKHFENEKIMTNSFVNMRTVPICKKCFKNIKKCDCLKEQTGAIVEDVISGLTYYCAFAIIMFYKAMATILFAPLYWKCRLKCEATLAYFGFDHVNNFVRKKLFVDLAGLTRRKIGYPEAFGILAGLLVTGYAIYKFNRSVSGVSFAEQTRLEDEQEYEKVIDKKEIYTKTDARPPKPGSFEKELTWIANDKKLSPLDLTPQILSSKQHSRDEFVDFISSNVIRLMIYDPATPKERYINNALVLKSNIIMCNAHFINNMKVPQFKMILVCGIIGDGVNDKIEILFQKQNIYYDTQQDLAIFTVHSLIPRKDITKYFAKRGVYTEATGSMLSRDFRSGNIINNIVHNVSFQDEYSDHWGVLPFKGAVTFGKATIQTIDGDCGSVLIVHTPKGHFIASLHRAGSNQNIVIGITLYEDIINNFLEKVNSFAISSGYPQISAGHTIQSLHPKSVFNFIEQGSAQVFGSSSSYKTNQKSNVCATPMQKFLVEREGYSINYTSPIMKGYKPYYLAGKDLVEPIVDFNENLLGDCSRAFYDDIIINLPAAEIREIVHKYDLFTSVNGAAGVAFVDSINRSTSAGYPYCTSKSKFLIKLPPQQGLQEPVKFTDDIETDIFHIIDEYKNGRRAHPVYVATLKDEAVSFQKRSESKTRVFGSAPISFVIVQRMYFLSIVRLIQTHKMAFESAIGVIAQTKEWELFYNKLKRFDMNIAGDFSKFDKKMCPSVILLAYDILIKIATLSGNYTEKDVQVMRGIATDTAYPFMLFNGDFVQLFGSNPSGHSLTVIINSLVNCIYLRYVYVTLYKENNVTTLSDYDIARTFKSSVELFVYGDDNEASTCCSWFNFKNIQRVFASVGIKYTPPTKDDSNYEFMEIEDIDFLKRTYRFDKDLGAIVAPLSLDSIHKMETVWVASDSISPEVQALNVISSAIREYFFHGRELFEKKREMYIRFLQFKGWEHGIDTTVLPTYEMLVEKYNDASEKVLGRLPEHSFEIQSGYIYENSTNIIIGFSVIAIFNMLLSVFSVFFLRSITLVLRKFGYRLPAYQIMAIISSANSNILIKKLRNFYHYIHCFSIKFYDKFFSFLFYVSRYILLPFAITYTNYQYLKKVYQRKTRVRPVGVTASGIIPVSPFIDNSWWLPYVDYEYWMLEKWAFTSMVCLVIHFTIFYRMCMSIFPGQQFDCFLLFIFIYNYLFMAFGSFSMEPLMIIFVFRYIFRKVSN